jgi:hypothetical protein
MSHARTNALGAPKIREIATVQSQNATYNQINATELIKRAPR